MKKYRIGWAVCIVLFAVNFLFSEGYAGPYMLALVLLVPAMSVLHTALTCRGIDAGLVMKDICVKGESVSGCLKIKNRGSFALFKIRVCLSAENLMTGEKHQRVFDTAISGKRETEIEFMMKNSLCGMIRLTFEEVTVYDIFGIYGKKIKTGFEEGIKVLPDMFPMVPHILPGIASDSESIEYSLQKPGDDASEIFGIREYREGDSMRNIHWKLTGKCDDIMVKLPSLPLENSILLLLETGIAGGGRITPEVCDALTEIYVTLSQSLAGNGIPHSLAWFDRRTDKMFLFDIDNEDDLNSAMGRLLSSGHGADEISTAGHYIREGESFKKAHLVYISPQAAGGMEEMFPGAGITQIICSAEAGASAGGDGNVIICTPQTYMHEVHEINI